jgi:hypothetical protein
LKKIVRSAPDPNRISNALSPMPSASSSRHFSGNSRLSPKKKVQSVPSVILKNEFPDAFRGTLDTTNTLDDRLSTKPRNLTCKPGPMNIATTGIDSAISFFMSKPASLEEMLFLSIAQEAGVKQAVFWARKLGVRYKLALARISRSL